MEAHPRPSAERELDPELEAALALLRVKDIGFNNGAKQGVYARLWCARTKHPKRDSEQVNLTRERTTLAQCAIDLLKLVNERHCDHLPAAEAEHAAAAAEAAAAGPSTPTDAFAAMAAARLVQPAAERAAAAEQRAAEARVAQKAAEKDLARPQTRPWRPQRVKLTDLRTRCRLFDSNCRHAPLRRFSSGGGLCTHSRLYLAPGAPYTLGSDPSS